MFIILLVLLYMYTDGKENEELAKVVARREEKWKEKVETERKEKREGTA